MNKRLAIYEGAHLVSARGLSDEENVRDMQIAEALGDYLGAGWRIMQDMDYPDRWALTSQSKDGAGNITAVLLVAQVEEVSPVLKATGRREVVILRGAK